MKKLVFLAFLLLVGLQVKTWFACEEFKNIYRFSAYDLQINLDDLIHNDAGLPFTLIRAYHNKITNSFLEVFRNYISYWDVKFLVNLLLPVGVFGLVWTFLYGWENKLILIFTAISLLLPFFEIFLKLSFNFPLKIILWVLPLTILSLSGLIAFLEQKNRKKVYLIVVVLLVLSVWWQFVMSAEIGNFCLK